MERPRTLQLARGRLEFGRTPLLMGILNVTPDSFSDGGRFARPARAVEQGLRLANEGAAILDVGGESTRPGADPVSAEEEAARVLPVIEGLLRKTEVPISIDSRKAAVVSQALEAGAQIVNDVSALGDPAMAELVAGFGAAVVLMHMRGEPRTMQRSPRYDDVVTEVQDFLRERLDLAERHGIARECMAVDPGLGFGKRLEDNLALMRDLGRLHELGAPVVLGASRKSFLGSLMEEPDPSRRLEGNLAAAARGAEAGAQILRVHDVAKTRRFLAAFLPLIHEEEGADTIPQ
jgi:dihydropteroate synthase